MTLPRSKYVQEGKEGVYHCYSRCVRRAFLYGFDAHTGRDFSHRKEWIVNRLRQLAGIFAVDVCAYAVMENHSHTILRTRPDVAGSWSDQEVARRWLTLFPKNNRGRGEATLPMEEQISALASCPERIKTLRRRLRSLSWFMGQLNEFIARAANKEDGVKGRFWESRFKCKTLLDEAAIAACMAYVDLNPIRAGRAKTPERSDFTSIQERIRTWRKEMMGTGCGDPKLGPEVHSSLIRNETISGEAQTDLDDSVDYWLCPISSEAGRRGILSMTAEEYFDLIDKSGRMIRLDKKGAIDADLRPILLRIGADPRAWTETISNFGDKFSLVAGAISSLREFADQIGRRWLKGVTAARVAFALSPAQPA